jgi:rare lipoprotein A
MVTNHINGRTATVKVNDCGPFRDGRKIDLSKRAAEKLGMVHKGTAVVKATVISKPPGASDCHSLASAGKRGLDD